MSTSGAADAVGVDLGAVELALADGRPVAAWPHAVMRMVPAIKTGIDMRFPISYLRVLLLQLTLSTG
jgi:hypothetical protein